MRGLRLAPMILERASSLYRARIDDDHQRLWAAIGGVSQFQLVRGFSREISLTHRSYLVQRRLQRVRKMIAKRFLTALRP